jgi:hypothetical protein
MDSSDQEESWLSYLDEEDDMKEREEPLDQLWSKLDLAKEMENDPLLDSEGIPYFPDERMVDDMSSRYYLLKLILPKIHRNWNLLPKERKLKAIQTREELIKNPPIMFKGRNQEEHILYDVYDFWGIDPEKDIMKAREARARQTPKSESNIKNRQKKLKKKEKKKEARINRVIDQMLKEESKKMDGTAPTQEQEMATVVEENTVQRSQKLKYFKNENLSRNQRKNSKKLFWWVCSPEACEATEERHETNNNTKRHNSKVLNEWKRKRKSSGNSIYDLLIRELIIKMDGKFMRKENSTVKNIDLRKHYSWEKWMTNKTLDEILNMAQCQKDFLSYEGKGVMERIDQLDERRERLLSMVEQDWKTYQIIKHQKRNEELNESRIKTILWTTPQMSEYVEEILEATGRSESNEFGRKKDLDKIRKRRREEEGQTSNIFAFRVVQNWKVNEDSNRETPRSRLPRTMVDADDRRNILRRTNGTTYYPGNP